uniref:Uncharacterized protein n=1 Tax=Helicotheca tamesis TaxID=374047 RepID=A0A7S2MK74_9STRA|mmetsp:Transcript_17271/g.23779  ORF Transcript_17271/g.23779 Transcript_17271/m.23779 type:complete len:326 (+) Transcript_17271:235-1212(+)|eukprot:CAMPEP_0185729782 /NCGR_PEP_ID=MMETSP1171-20130828/7292_1 /TAXON_ID=374046 /ORGANISM="Helicotheca tamensis, Strain CCMP826" /LENGTH=325 /DNA_ID=CAMNT_0028398701 /DNA_START=170 /DNA_END=1147 /DNA_ORIENTATION=+
MVMTVRFASIAAMVGVCVFAFIPSPTMAMDLPWYSPAVEFQKQLKMTLQERMDYQISSTQRACNAPTEYPCHPHPNTEETNNSNNEEEQSVVPIFNNHVINTCLWYKYYNNNNNNNADDTTIPLSPKCREHMSQLLYMSKAAAKYTRFVSFLVFETTCIHLIMAAVLIYIAAEITSRNIEETTAVQRTMLLFTWSIFLLYASVMIPYAMFVCVVAVVVMYWGGVLPLWYCIGYMLSMHGLLELTGSPGVLMTVDSLAVFVLGLTALLYSWHVVVDGGNSEEEEDTHQDNDETKYHLVVDEEDNSGIEANEEVYEGVPLSMQTHIV